MQAVESKGKIPIILLVLLVSFASVSAVFITPALPEIAQFFSITSSQSQLLITFFLIGYAIGQLPYGPLANRFGRKKALYIGLSLATLGSLLCIWASMKHNFWALIGARFFTALGASCGLKMVFTMVGDAFPQTQARRVMSYVVLAFAIAPSVGVSIAGSLTERIGWTSCFYFLALYSLLLLCLSVLLPETCKKLDKQALQVPAIIKGFLQQIKHRRILLCAFIMGGGASISYVFFSQAPFIAEDLLGLSPEQFGLFNLIPPTGLLLGSFAGRHLAKTKTPLATMVIGCSISLCGIALMTTAFLLSWVNIISLFCFMALILLGNSLIYANITVVAMEGAHDKANAAAVLNFINMSICVTAVLALELFDPDDPVVLPFILLICGFIVAGLIRSLSKVLHSKNF